MPDDELQRLRSRVRELEAELARLQFTDCPAAPPAQAPGTSASTVSSAPTNEHLVRPLSLPEYKRYGRQMVLDRFGLPGQLKLKRASVLVVGAGGLGCPAVQYLAAAGVGHIGIVDHDTVETSNLARQILHNDARTGWLKAASAKAAAQSINPHIRITSHPVPLLATNALTLFAPYDLILDCTDNPATRYLVSDAAVLLGKTLVSGSALRCDGQVVVLNKKLNRGAGRAAREARRKAGSLKAGKYTVSAPRTETVADGDGEDETISAAEESNEEERGPCYRCLFKSPPDQVVDCEDGGVLGTVTGVIGTLQALEAIKIITGLDDGTPPILLVFSALSPTTPFRSFPLRPRRHTACRACGDARLVPDKIWDVADEDYVTFCGTARGAAQELGMEHRVGVRELASVLKGSTWAVGGSGSLADGQRDDEPVQGGAGRRRPAVVVDVRPPVEFGIAHLPGSVNIPLVALLREPLQPRLFATPSISSSAPESHPNELTGPAHFHSHTLTAPASPEIYFICKRGNDSQRAVRAVRQALVRRGESARSDGGEGEGSMGSAREGGAAGLKDVIGGLRAWSREVDAEFPVY